MRICVKNLLTVIIISILLINSQVTWSQIPDALKISLEPKPDMQPLNPTPIAVSALTVNSTHTIFNGCVDGNYYAAFQLYYDLGNSNTQQTWSVDLTISLLNNGVVVAGWPKSLRVSTAPTDQTFISTVFHTVPIACSNLYTIRVDARTLSGTVPQANVVLKMLLRRDYETFIPTAAINLSSNYTAGTGITSLGWAHLNKGVVAHDVEWVFIASHESTTIPSPDSAFSFKEAARITVAGGVYNFSHLTYFPAGKIWYRVRAIGYNPVYPDHRIPGNWFYAPTPITVANHQASMNWQEQTVFAEDGKYKKVMSYYDGTLRQRQALTNLSTENVTVVGETAYDYEGRKAIDILPVPAADATLTFKSNFNPFLSQDATVTSKTSLIRKKFHYDNKQLINSTINTSGGAGKYYSTNNSSNSVLKNYIPDAEGYVYSQTEYLNDGTGRVSRQSGVGKEFRLDRTDIQNLHTSRYYYGSAAPAEIIRLFGSSVGNSNHYKKNLVVDANGQANVTYQDQEDRVIATALVGDPPVNVLPLPSHTSAPTTPVTINLSTKNEKKDGISVTTQKILNAKAGTSYTFTYDFNSLGSDIPNVGCVSCSYDLKITITGPNGELLLLPVIAGNEDASKFSYELKNITTPLNCVTPQTPINISFVLSLTELGDYTLQKSITTKERTFEEVKTEVTLTTEVQEIISEIRNSYQVDPAECAICNSCSDSEDIIEGAITEIATVDCENIRYRIIQALRDSSSDPTVDPTEEMITNHPDYCHYLLCVKNKSSEVFEKKIARIANWSAALTPGYQNLINVDPFFNNLANYDQNLSGLSYKSAMQSKLNNLLLGVVPYDNNGDSIADGSTEFRGTILQITNPALTSYYVNDQGLADVNGYHILYYDLMKRKDEGIINHAQYVAELNKQQWIMYKAFYLEAKRKMKLEIAEYANCPSARVEVDIQDSLPVSREDITNWSEIIVGSDTIAISAPVTEPEIEASIFSIESVCNIELTPADSTTISGHLNTYFNSNPQNFFRLIFTSDLGNNSSLNSIQTILNNYGCPLDSVAMLNPLSCLRDTTITLINQVIVGPATVPTPVSGGDPDCEGNPCPKCLPQAMTSPEVAEQQMVDSYMQTSMSQSEEGGVSTFAITCLPTLEEYNALWDLYYALNGDLWTDRTGWSTGDPDVLQSVTGWAGVTTDVNCHVTAFGHQFSNGNTGTLPNSIGDLIYLEVLFIQYGLTGTIPSTIGNLTNLEQLILSQNNLTGSIPATLGNLTQFTSSGTAINTFVISLSDNNLTGSIPPELGNLTRLNWLRLHDNQLTGSIPASFGQLTSLTWLFLKNNKLTGNIPVELGELACNNTQIWLENNQLYGTVPYKLRNTNDLKLQNNRFTIADLKYIKQNWLGSNDPEYTPQDSVDLRRTIKAKKGKALTLTTNIDRSVTIPSCQYQWFKNGVALNTLSTTGHTYTISNVNDTHAGDYYYIIQNTATPGLTLTSRKIKVQPVMFIGDLSEEITICLEYDTLNSTLAGWTFNVNWTAVVDSCMARAAREDSILIDYAINVLIDSVATEYYAKYSTNCLANTIENLAYTYTSKEYHYTLYYYDQAGNLVQTVPPQGVKPMGQDSINQVIAGAILYPQHKLVTQYQYNSINQSIWQKTPDAGSSQFWYNDKGQLRLSQNAQQYKDAKYSYTKYDAQGRITEVGEMYTAITLTPLMDSVETALFPKAAFNTIKDITKTYYDFPDPAIQATFPQQYLRNRVSYVQVLEKDAPDVIATYYTYDIHGNVKSLLQQIPGLGNKRTDYVYDLVSGKVNYVMYQYGQTDQFFHKYTYDADNRIKEVYTSTDGYVWDKEAAYQYYQHGPLARVVLGEYTGVQGLDYYYTLQGWIKGVNMPYASDPSNDGNTPSKVGRDVFAYTLGYFKDDYKPRNASLISTIPDTRDLVWTRYNTMYPISGTNAGYYNGNIAWMETDLKKVGQVKGNRKKGVQAMLYQYDQLHRIRTSRSLTSYVAGVTGFTSRNPTPPAAYDEDFTYDANGNLLTLSRRDGNTTTPAVLDNFNYQYYPGTNKLRYLNPITRDTIYTGNIVTNNKVYNNIRIESTANVANGTDAVIKAVSSINWDPDPMTFDLNDNATFRAYVLGDDEGAFNYDAIGNLIADQDKGVKIEWTPYGKVRKVSKTNGDNITFRYDATGNRIEKKSLVGSTTTITRYVRDASGNVMGVYSDAVLTEQPIYGSSRLGMYRGGAMEGKRILGQKQYELTNHLGNVLSVVTNNIRLQADSAWAEVVNANDYYAFGSTMPNRNFSSSTYRYGFNGKEKDTENTWGETEYDYGFRIYNPRYGKFLSVDPLTQSYPWYTPYQFAGNKPLVAIDLDGLEEKLVLWGPDSKEPIIYLVNTEHGKRQIDIMFKSFNKGIHIDVGQFVEGYDQYSGNGKRDYPLYKGTLTIDSRNGYSLLTYEPPEINIRKPSDLETGFVHAGQIFKGFFVSDEKSPRVARKMVGGIVSSAFTLPITSVAAAAGLLFGVNEIASAVEDANQNDPNADANLLRDFADEQSPQGGEVYDGVKLYFDLKSLIRSRNNFTKDFMNDEKAEGVIDGLNGINSFIDVTKDVKQLKKDADESKKSNDKN